MISSILQSSKMPQKNWNFLTEILIFSEKARPRLCEGAGVLPFGILGSGEEKTEWVQQSLFDQLNYTIIFGPFLKLCC
jgi:hypothetical protein